MPSHDIQSAALFINNALVSKGYLHDSERLFFGESEKRTDKNDTRIINTIYALMNTIDNDSKIKESNQKRLGELGRELERESNIRARLEVKYENLEKQLQTTQRSSHNLELSLEDARNKSHELRELVIRSQNSVQQLKLQSANELRKRDMELAWLRERVRDPRRASKSLSEFSSKVPSAISGSLDSKSLSQSGSSITDDGQFRLHTELSSATMTLSQELTSFNSELVSENKLLLSLLHKVKNAILSLTEGSIHEKLAGFDVVLNGQSSDSAGVAVRAASTEELGEQVLLSIARIRDILNSPNFVSLAELKEKEQMVESLKDQLKEVTGNWEKALKTMDEWRAYRQIKRGGDVVKSDSDQSGKKEESEKNVEKPKEAIPERVSLARSVKTNKANNPDVEGRTKPTNTVTTSIPTLASTNSKPKPTEKFVDTANAKPRPKLTSIQLTPKVEKFRKVSKAPPTPPPQKQPTM